jgi:hypothetical protein
MPAMFSDVDLALFVVYATVFTCFIVVFYCAAMLLYLDTRTRDVQICPERGLGLHDKGKAE